MILFICAPISSKVSDLQAQIKLFIQWAEPWSIILLLFEKLLENVIKMYSIFLINYDFCKCFWLSNTIFSITSEMDMCRFISISSIFLFKKEMILVRFYLSKIFSWNTSKIVRKVLMSSFLPNNFNWWSFC